MADNQLGYNDIEGVRRRSTRVVDNSIAASTILRRSALAYGAEVGPPAFREEVHDSLRIASRFAVTHKTRPIASFFKDREHFEEATRGWKRGGVAVPSFLADRVANHEAQRAKAAAAVAAAGGDNTIAPATHRVVTVAPAGDKSNGFVSHKGEVGVYLTSFGSDGKHTRSATNGDVRALFVQGRKTQAAWKGANCSADHEVALTQQQERDARTGGAATTAAAATVPAKSMLQHYRDFVDEVDAASRSDEGAFTAGRGRSVGGAGEWHAIGAKRARRRRDPTDIVGSIIEHEQGGGGGGSAVNVAASVGRNSAEYRYAQEVLRHADRLGYQYGLYGEKGKLTRDLPDTIVQPDIGAPITVDFINDLLDGGHRVPMDVLLLRPFMEYSMSSAVLMKGGYETGATFVGHSDFILGDDVVSKLHCTLRRRRKDPLRVRLSRCSLFRSRALLCVSFSDGNFTFYSKALVTQPKNVIICPNVFCQGYVRGNGTRFFKRDGQNKIKAYDPNKGEHKADLISVLIPYGSGDRLPNPLDIMAHTAYNADDEEKKPMATGDKPAHYMDADLVTRIFQLDSFARDLDSADCEPFQEHQRTQNHICYRGHQFSYDVSTKHHTAVTINTGHWGPSVYPGCGRVRAGEMKYLQRVNYNPSAVAVRD